MFEIMLALQNLNSSLATLLGYVRVCWDLGLSSDISWVSSGLARRTQNTPSDFAVLLGSLGAILGFLWLVWGSHWLYWDSRGISFGFLASRGAFADYLEAIFGLWCTLEAVPNI